MSDRTLTDEDVTAIVKALNGADHCSFSEEERVMVKRFIRFSNKAASAVGIAVIMGVFGALAVLWKNFGGGQ